MTVTLNKTVIEPKWTTHQIQENVARVHAMTFMTAMNHLGKVGGEKAIEEFQNEMRTFKVEHLKTLGVKTPIELAKALAEFEVNVFGSKIEIWGDETKAFIQYNQCAMWNSMKKFGKLTEKQEEEMGAKYEHCMQMLAKDFGFKSETKFEGETCILSFSK
jgi:hypothetical protein